MAKRSSATESKRRGAKSPYFMQPARGGGVTVYRRPVGNRAVPKECGTLPTQAMAAALVRQLQRAEGVLNDLFLEATDDGIEALEAVLAACRAEVLRQGERPARGTARGSRRGRQQRGPRAAHEHVQEPQADPEGPPAELEG
jgi:hypothetical protein